MSRVPRASGRSAVARQRGFTLLEVLVAFALLAGAAVVLLSILSNGLRDVADAERHGEAALHARSLMDNVGRIERLRPGLRQGTLDIAKCRRQVARVIVCQGSDVKRVEVSRRGEEDRQAGDGDEDCHARCPHDAHEEMHGMERDMDVCGGVVDDLD